MVATVNTMALVAVHNNPSPTSVTTNLNPTVISTGAIAEKQRVVSQETTSYPFPLNIWRRLIEPPTAGPQLFTRSISETLALAESIKRKITRLIPVFQLYDDFESGTYTYSAEPQASPNNLWTVQFRGGGTAGVHTPTSSTDTTLVAFQTPQTATSSGQTFSTLVTSNSSYTDFTLEFDVRTIAQLRTGSAPNNWEVAWIFWHWTDNNHQYYFTPKMSGVELGKKDTGGTQIILDTPGTTFTNTLGTWYHVKIVSVGNHFKTWVNGTLYNDYVDTGVGGFPSASNFAPTSAMYSGKVGMYCEDSQVEFDNISITPIEGFFLKEPAPYQYPIKLIPHIAGETLHLTESISRRVIRKLSETLHLAESVLRKVIRKLTDTVTLTESDKRIPIPHIAETITLTETSIKKKVFKPISETLHLVESILRKPKPKIAGETITLTESDKRKVIPHIAETITLSESVLRKVIRPKSETLTLTEAISAHKLFKRAISETLTLTESKLRKVIPHIAETLTLSESVKKKAFKPISETLHLVESDIRKAIPHIAGETITLTESVLRKVIRKITDTLHLTESTLRKVIRPVSETLHLVESILRKFIPKISETLHLAESISAHKVGAVVENISEAIGLAESRVRKFIPIIGIQLWIVNVADTISFSESVTRKPKPKITETLHLAESILRKPLPRIAAETLTLTESIRRKVVRKISESITLGEILKIGGQFVVMIHESLTLSESVLRKSKPNITAETLHLVESFLRRAIPHIGAETINLAESFVKKTVRKISESLFITENHIHRITGHPMHPPRFTFIFHDNWRTVIPKRYHIDVEESIKLSEKVETDQSGPSYLWKLVPWRKK